MANTLYLSNPLVSSVDKRFRGHVNGAPLRRHSILFSFSCLYCERDFVHFTWQLYDQFSSRTTEPSSLSLAVIVFDGWTIAVVYDLSIHSHSLSNGLPAMFPPILNGADLVTFILRRRTDIGHTITDSRIEHRKNRHS